MNFKNYKKIKTAIKGRGNYTLWVADTPAKKAIGLSKISFLPKYFGMIFVNDKDVNTPYTMKNTKIPLTIMFLDKNFNVLEAFNCRPFEKKSIQPSQNYRYVIEI